MINVNILKNIAKRYKVYNDVLNRYKKEMIDSKKLYKDQLDELIEQRNKIEDPIERDNFVLKNQLLNTYEHYYYQIKIKEKLIRELLLQENVSLNQKKIDICGNPYILLKHLYDESYDLINLKEKEIINLNDLDSNTQEFLVKLLNIQDALIGYATVQDLPLLMNIMEKENFYEKVGRLEMIHKCMETKRQYERAKIFDKYKHISRNSSSIDIIVEDPITKEMEEIEYDLPFIYDSGKIEEMWYKLDELKLNLSEDEYLSLYYKYLLLFANDIEKTYIEAPEDLKKVVIDAYCDFANGDETFGAKKQFRTSSPIINIEVLKRKNR